MLPIRPVARRALLRGLALAALSGPVLGALAACQPAAPPTPTPVPAPTPTPQVIEKVVTKEVVKEVVVTPTPKRLRGKLTFWGHDNHPIDNAKPGFQERYPEVELDFQHIGDWLTKFRAALAAGQGVPDLVWLEATTIQELGAKGVLLETDPVVVPIKDKFAPGKLAECFVVKRAKYYAMPGDIGLVGLYYRPDLLQEAGISEVPADLTFDDFVKIASEVKQKTNRAAFLFPSEGWAWPFEIILHQLGGSITSPDGTQVTVDNEIGLKAMEAVKRLWDTKANLDTPWLKPPYWGAIKANKLVSDYMPAWMRGFMEAEVKSPEQGAGKWRLMPLPKHPGGISRTAEIGGASLASTRFTKDPELVYAFMQYAFGTLDGATAVGSWGIIPAYLPYLDSPVFQNQKSPIFGDFKFGPVWAALARERSEKYVRTPVFGEADQIIAQNIMPILRGEVTIPAGLKAIGDKIREANQRYQF